MTGTTIHSRLAHNWNGNESHFTYTSAWSVRGRLNAHELALEIEGDIRPETYLNAAHSIQEDICSNLVNLVNGTKERS